MHSSFHSRCWSALLSGAIPVFVYSARLLDVERHLYVLVGSPMCQVMVYHVSECSVEAFNHRGLNNVFIGRKMFDLLFYQLSHYNFVLNFLPLCVRGYFAPFRSRVCCQLLCEKCL